MLPEILNLFDGAAPAQNPGQSRVEKMVPLLNLPNGRDVRLEHLVSHGQPSPPGFWYDQPQDEWVALLKGSATLAFDEGTLDLVAGDSLTIPAQLRHRVASVSIDAVWLALHFDTSR